MPDIVPTRPAAGAPIETSWGTAVHDMLEGIQTGRANIVFSSAGQASAVVTFPRAYAAPPVVVCSAENASTFLPACLTVTATTAQVSLRHYDNSPQTGTFVCQWMAIGTLA